MPKTKPTICLQVGARNVIPDNFKREQERQNAKDSQDPCSKRHRLCVSLVMGANEEQLDDGDTHAAASVVAQLG